jgi:GNAT superfamily N-acetyltransferase
LKQRFETRWNGNQLATLGRQSGVPVYLTRKKSPCSELWKSDAEPGVEAELRKKPCSQLVSTLGAVNIRLATAADAEQISSVIIGLSAPFYTSPARAGAEPFLASVSAEAQRRNLSSPDFLYYVAESDGQFAGVVALRENAHLFHLFVASSFQRAGLATRLWSIVKAEALAQGNTGRFTVNSSLNAVPVYERFGFVRKGDVQQMHGISFQPMQLDTGPLDTQPGQAELRDKAAQRRSP